MAQTIANMASVIKDMWTAERVQKQFYNKNPLLEKLRAAAGTKVDGMGLQAQVPIHAQRAAGYTSVAAAGGVLNPATNQTTAQATYTLVYHWFQIALETAVLNQTEGSARSIIAGKDLEMQGAVDDISKQISRQFARNGDGILAEAASGGASTTISLLTPANGGHGYDAIVRGHIYVGMPIDVGTTADTDSLATGAVITAISESPTAPTITTATSVTTVAGTHFIYWANPNSATAASPEVNGLENMVGAAALGGINPATPGSEYWQSFLDTTTTVFSLDMALNLQLKVFQKDGSYNSNVFTSAKQMANFYATLQNQVRFAGDMKLGAGGVGGLVGLDWNGIGVNVMPDIYDADWFHLMVEDMVMIQGAIKKPTWVSDLEGAGGDIRWAQGTTGFGNAMVWPFQIGVQRRNRMAAAKQLT
jgi:hypothetical protein